MSAAAPAQAGGIVVAGYSDVGYRCTKWLLEAKAPVRLVYTHPDHIGETPWWGSMPQLAKEHGVPVVVLEELTSLTESTRLAAIRPDFFFSFYFRKMIPESILRTVTRGALNMHGSLLPQFRGRSPVNWAILKGATRTGASLHYMTEKPDAGDLVDQEAVPIGPDDDALTVAKRVGDAAVTVIARAWPQLQAGTAPRRALDLSKGSIFGGRKPEDGVIDWNGSAKEVHDLVRAVAKPWPGAFTDVFGPRVTIWKTRVAPYAGHDVFPGKIEPSEGGVIVYCGDDRCVEILEARPHGERDMDARTFAEWVRVHGPQGA